MEAKLILAAAQLPETNLAFCDILQAAQAKKHAAARPRILRRVLLTAALVLCLCTTVLAYGKTHYGLWSAYRSESFADVEILSRRYDYTFPEELCGWPFQNMSTTHGAPHGAFHLDALLTPTYKLHSIGYGKINVSFGTTEKESWKYHFSVADDGSCSEENVTSGSQSSAEYKGYLLHFYAIEDRYSIRWEDEDRKLVVDVTCFDTADYNIALDAAKTLIEQNQ